MPESGAHLLNGSGGHAIPERQVNPDDRPLALDRVQAQLTAVALDDRSHDRQTQPGARDRSCCGVGGPEEPAEQLRQVDPGSEPPLQLSP